MSESGTLAAPSTTSAPGSLDHWQRLLQPGAIPVASHVKTAAIQKLHTASGNAKNIAAILCEDPVLVLHIVHKANRSLASSDNEIKSLSHAISLLGFPQTEEVLRAAPAYETGNFAQFDIFRQQLNISQHAAWQLQGWAEHLPRWREDELFLATLLHRAPLWALWHQAPEIMTTLHELRSTNRGGHHARMEERLLGCSLQSLAAGLCRRWRLPTLAQRSWLPGERGQHRQWIMLSRIIPEQAHLALESFPELQRLSNSPAFAIALANRLADAADWGWHSPRTQRLQRILATCLSQPLAGAIRLTHEQAAQAVCLPDAQHPAHQLLGFYHRNTPAPQPRGEPEPEPIAAREPEPETPAHPVDTLSGFILRLRQQPGTINDLPTLFEQALALLSRDVLLDRTCALLIHGPSRELRTAFSTGCEHSPALARFRHRLQRGDLFNKLLQKPLSLQVHGDNYARIAPLLPAGFKQACASNQFFVMSIFAGHKPIGVLYADRATSNRPLSDQQYALFKQLCSAVSQCIAERAG